MVRFGNNLQRDELLLHMVLISPHLFVFSAPKPKGATTLMWEKQIDQKSFRSGA